MSILSVLRGAAAALFLAVPLSVAAAEPSFTAEDIDAAVYEGGALPSGQSALTAKVQILLDRAHVSPGVIDGWKGGMSESALRAFEIREGLTADGVMDEQVWQALGGPQAGKLTQRYEITGEDTAGLSDSLPEDYAELAKLDWLGFERVSERLAERFHMDEDFLIQLNPKARFEAGETIVVADPGANLEAVVSRMEISKSARRLAAFDESGKMVANYPVAVGSRQTPTPTGTHGVSAIALEPTYTYDPDVNFQQGDNTEQLLLPPGANGPVGLVWIDLDKPTYGIHGTSDPSKLFKEYSHGCVRMTNWDGMELVEAIEMSSSVEFVE